MKILNIGIVFLVLASNAEACDQKEALKAAREYVLKESPKGSKISLLKTSEGISYTATLLDDVGSYTSSGRLKITSGKDGKCGVESLQSSSSNQYKSGASEVISSSKTSN